MAFAALGDGDRAAGLFSLLNPINHARTRAEVHRYKVEPYVVAADVYAAPAHVRRGGWTWYTGSAGWMQRAGIESILGQEMQGEFLQLDPCIPKDWPSFEMTVLYGAARYEIRVENPNRVSRGVLSATLDGVAVTQRPLRLLLLDDAKTHLVQVTLGMLAVPDVERKVTCGSRPARSENRGDTSGYNMVLIMLIPDPPPKADRLGAIIVGRRCHGEQDEDGATKAAGKTKQHQPDRGSRAALR